MSMSLPVLSYSTFTNLADLWLILAFKVRKSSHGGIDNRKLSLLMKETNSHIWVIAVYRLGDISVSFHI